MDDPKRCPDAQLDIAATVLLTARSLDEAAAKLGVSARTLRRWRADRRLARRLAGARAEVMADALYGLRAAAAKAVAVLRGGLARRHPQGERIKAASLILRTLLSADARTALRDARSDESGAEDQRSDEEFQEHLRQQRYD